MGEAGLLGRMSTSTSIPLEEVATLSSANDHIRFVRVEHGLSHLVLAGKSHFRTGSKTERVQVNSTIRFIKAPLIALAHTSQEELTMVR